MVNYMMQLAILHFCTTGVNTIRYDIVQLFYT